MSDRTLVDAKDLVGVREVARRAGVSYRTVQAWRLRHDGFPDFFIPGQYLYLWPDILEWLQDTGRDDKVLSEYK